MLYCFPYISNHKSFRLNKHLKVFFRSLRDVDENSAFYPIDDYFHPEFVTWLNRTDQATLLEHFEKFFNAYKILSAKQRATIVDKFYTAQSINVILDNVHFDGISIQSASMPIGLRTVSKLLFQYLYSTTLTSFGNIKEHYKLLYDSLPSITCPFCGIERLNAPSLRKADYDHILIQSKYIYSTVNMINLAPMGTECNRNFKGSKDVIYINNARTVYYSPFTTHYNIKISLAGSVPPQKFGENGNWIVQIIPDNLYTRRWNTVFKIKKRYSEQMLDGCYVEWLKDFKIYVGRQGVPTTSVDLRKHFKELGSMLLENPLSEPNLVKGAFYKFLSSYTDRNYNKAILKYVSTN